jgi:large subunit ribosomal protein L13
MRVQIQKTPTTTPDQIERKWYLVDAEGHTLGRIASKIANILRGKHKPYFVPNLDCGDYVVVLNCGKIRVTGRRMEKKIYYRYSGYVGGLYSRTLREQLNKHPRRVLELAVKGMLPKGPIGKQMLGKMKLYTGVDHPHAPQKPEVLAL